MTERERDTSGRFEAKGHEHRTLRSIRLTETAWRGLESRANEEDMTRGDLIEALVAGDVSWDAEDDKPDYDFDVDEVAEILQDALTLKANAGGKIKTKIKEALELMGYEPDEDN